MRVLLAVFPAFCLFFAVAADAVPARKPPNSGQRKTEADHGVEAGFQQSRKNLFTVHVLVLGRAVRCGENGGDVEGDGFAGFQSRRLSDPNGSIHQNHANRSQCEVSLVDL